METKSEYKMTDLGEIPIDWGFDNIGSITIEHKQGYYTKESYSSKGIKFIRITDLNNQVINYDNMPTLDISDKDYESYKVSPGDFLFARSGTIGRYGIVRQSDEKAIFASYLIRFQFDKERALNNFIGYFYQSYYSKKQLGIITQGSSNININANNIKSLKIPLPPLKEQQKIAEILSTVDEQIEQIDQLIQKTKELKKGLMQQLLKKGIGHTEFKQTELGEIPVEWTVYNINDVAEVQTGGTPLRSNSNFWKNGSIPWMSSGEVNKKFIDEVAEMITEEGFNNSNTTMLPKGTVMLAMNGQGKTRGTVAYLKIETTCNQSLAGIITNENYNSLFLYYFLEHSYDNLRNINGEGRSGLNLKLIRDFKVIAPSLNEQQKIAEILSSLDEDIEGYEEEKAKYEELKKGLMQQLLTGKTRVKVD